MNASTQIFSISEEEFNSYALDLFRYQAEQVAVYKMYLAHLQVDVTTIHEIQAIPFLPISFFKTSVILDQVKKDDMHMFQSSGTTGQIPSIHYVSDLALYEQSFLEGFSHFFGSPSRYVILALLPSYLERGHSSLVYMVQKLIHESGHIQSGFYLDQMEELADTIKQMEEQQQPVLLFGVTYALLDFAAQFPMPLQHTCLIETGGMKGRRRELPRMAVHDILKKAFGLKQIASWSLGLWEMVGRQSPRVNLIQKFVQRPRGSSHLG